MRVGKRLEKILDLVDLNLNAVADVGTDHGFLALRVIEEKNAKVVYATDISKGSLDKAIDLANKYNLNDRLICIRTDGFKNMSVNLDVAVIAGMGGNEIVKILKERPESCVVKEYLLQPMQDTEILREYLLRNGYAISYDETVKDRDKFYSVIQCSYTGKICRVNKQSVVIGITDKKKLGKDFKEFLEFNINSLKAREKYLSEFDKKRLSIFESFFEK